MMRKSTTTVLAAGLVLLVGCSSYTNQSTTDDMAARLVALERERQWLETNQERLAAELEAAKRRNIELEQEVDLKRGSLVKVEQELTNALKPEITNGT
ncbi:MAG: hypothetical protein HP492_17815, partial [Nitrospira sp.]|nr:hypothetical protein [Nitrospira sp.]